MDLSRLGSVMRTRWGAVSDIGPVRSANEDCWLAAPPLFAIADGMGGHARGDEASRTAVDTLRAGLTVRDPDVVDVDRAVCQAAIAVNTLAADGSGEAPPGSTLTGMVETRRDGLPHWLVFNVGDSRTYLVAGDDILQLTRDHVTDIPGLTHVITQTLGAGMPGLPDPDYFLVPARRGDRYVLCSDGLHGVLDDETIRRLTTEAPDPQVSAARLADAAISGGTRDNVTVVVVECTEVSPASPGEAGASVRIVESLRRATTTTAPRVATQAEPLAATQETAPRVAKQE
jgi:PPM family protein phosphatase